MRRSVAIVLALLFSWMLVLPAFASTTRSNLPACCRKDGKHHCMQSASSDPSTPRIAAVNAKCPCCPSSFSLAPSHELWAPAASDAIFAGLVRHPAVSPQTEAAFRVSFFRAHQKRGPPSRLG
jgi:hypothetical protein